MAQFARVGLNRIDNGSTKNGESAKDINRLIII